MASKTNCIMKVNRKNGWIHPWARSLYKLAKYIWKNFKINRKKNKICSLFFGYPTKSREFPSTNLTPKTKKKSPLRSIAAINFMADISPSKFGMPNLEILLILG